MTDDGQEHRARPALQDDAGSEPFDERCLAAGKVEHAKASAACQRGMTYLNSDQIEAAFHLIEHQMLTAGCAEAADNVIRHAKRK